MKIRAKVTFVSGPFSARIGDVINVPDRRAARLIALGFADGVENTEKVTGDTPDRQDTATVMDMDEEKPVQKRKTVRTGKPAGKAAAKNG